MPGHTQNNKGHRRISALSLSLTTTEQGLIQNPKHTASNNPESSVSTGLDIRDKFSWRDTLLSTGTTLSIPFIPSINFMELLSDSSTYSNFVIRGVLLQRQDIPIQSNPIHRRWGGGIYIYIPSGLGMMINPSSNPYIFGYRP